MRQLLRANTSDPTPVRETIAAWLASHPTVLTLSLFAPLRGEPDLLPLISHFPQRRWAFPRVRGETLSLHLITDPSRQLTPGAFDILEPTPEIPEISPTRIDAFLCPGLAFSPDGNRLGRGKGFYDRLLTHARNDALKLGIAYSFQIVPTVFAEPHDIRMDAILHG